MANESAAHNREVLERMRTIMRDAKYDQLGEVMHPDFVQVIPQSGERVVGIENFRKILEHITAGTGSGLGLDEAPYVAGSEEHYMLTPTFNVVKVADRGDEITSYVKTRYPDGSEWYIVTFFTFKDGLVAKRVDFFAPFFEGPEWRKDWVEKE